MKKIISLFFLVLFFYPLSVMADEYKIKVPVSDLVFHGIMTNPPDELGAYVIGLKLPQKGLVAKECEENTLLLGVRPVGIEENGKISDKSLKDIKTRKENYYNVIKKIPHGGYIVLSLHSDSIVVRNKNGGILAKECVADINPLM